MFPFHSGHEASASGLLTKTPAPLLIMGTTRDRHRNISSSVTSRAEVQATATVSCSATAAGGALSKSGLLCAVDRPLTRNLAVWLLTKTPNSPFRPVAAGRALKSSKAGFRSRAVARRACLRTAGSPLPPEGAQGPPRPLCGVSRPLSEIHAQITVFFANGAPDRGWMTALTEKVIAGCARRADARHHLPRQDLRNHETDREHYAMTRMSRDVI